MEMIVQDSSIYNDVLLAHTRPCIKSILPPIYHMTKYTHSLHYRQSQAEGRSTQRSRVGHAAHLQRYGVHRAQRLRDGADELSIDVLGMSIFTHYTRHICAINFLCGCTYCSRYLIVGLQHCSSFSLAIFLLSCDGHTTVETVDEDLAATR